MMNGPLGHGARFVSVIAGLGMVTSALSAQQFDEPKLSVFTAASTESSDTFGSEVIDLGPPKSEALELWIIRLSNQSALDKFGQVLLTIDYNLDPWLNFNFLIENNTDEVFNASAEIVLGPLAPGAGDTMFNSMIMIESIDGTTDTAADGFAQVTDVLGATTRLQPLDSAGFFDGDREIGASIQDPSLSLLAGESATASMSFDVASGPNGAFDPDAFYGAFVVDFDLSVSPGDTAIVSGRVELVPAPGAAAIGVLAVFTTGRRRSRRVC